MAHTELATGSEALRISPKLVTEGNEGEQRQQRSGKEQSNPYLWCDLCPTDAEQGPMLNDNP